MHSAFLAELLNPHGSHGQKDVFLKLFVKAFCFKENAIDTLSCKTKVEESIGTISADRKQGGRIDIVITDKDYKQIIIENKIYAGDQEHQLTRYYNYSRNADLIYLTLDGKQPNAMSKDELLENTDYKCYSYKNNILDWLELCRKEVAIYPIVREAISHYINLIKYLTNQTPNESMQDELSNLLKSNLQAAFSIADNLDNACDKVAKDFGEVMIKESETIGLQCIYRISFDDNYTGLWVSKPEWEYANIGFQFWGTDKYLIYGISLKENELEMPVKIDAELKSQLKELPNNSTKDNEWWPWYRRVEEPYDNWSKYQAWGAIIDGSMKNYMMDKIKYLLNLIEEKNIEM